MNPSNVIKLLLETFPLSDSTDTISSVEAKLAREISEYLESNTDSVPHVPKIHSFRRPTFCDHCNKFLVGLAKQGFKCSTCGLDFCKECAFDSLCNPKMGDSKKDEDNTNGLSSRNPLDSLKLVLNSFRPQESTASSSTRSCSSRVNPGVSVPHSFEIRTYTFPTKCQFCTNFLFGLVKQGYQCKVCEYNVHTKCLDKVKDDCRGGETQNDLSESSNNASANGYAEAYSSCQAKERQYFNINNNHSSLLADLDRDIRGTDMPNIPLMRIVQSVKCTKNGRRCGNDYQTPAGTTVTSGTPHMNLMGEMFDPIVISEPADHYPLYMRYIGNGYEYFPDEILGSGQFGVVYGGRHRPTNKSFAIKIIDKKRFPHEQEAQLRNETKILKPISHPGIVGVEYFFENEESLYVIMEKLQSDMLEMILNYHDEETGIENRLTERITRFLIHQILVALSHLHKQNIVHCDLKPENVLLATRTKFPHVKLCDFGFARIIGEKSFRRSVVGTPAYLAPEVLNNAGYNRTLDMWSVGVIIYVSLSGTFPFNEEEVIHDQIKNASFMYPADPWDEISPEAKDLIQNLLQVNSRDRFTVDKSLIHPWLNDYETWCDLRQLEYSVNKRWLTHESDDERWKNYCLSHNLRPPAIPDPFGESTRLVSD